MPEHDFPTTEEKQNAKTAEGPEEAILCIGAGFALAAGLVVAAAMLTPAEVVDNFECKVGQIMDEMTSYHGSSEEGGPQTPRRDCN